MALRRPSKPNKDTSKVSGSVHRKTPLFRPNLVTKDDPVAGDIALGGDPFLKIVNPQFIHKRDYTRYTLPYAQCDLRADYNKAKADSATKGMRISWLPPYIDQQKNSGNVIAADPRGNFGDIGSTLVSFKNLTKQPITVCLNSPRARIDDPNKVYVRRYKKELTLKPGQIRFYRVEWGDRANIFTPYTVYVPDASKDPTVHQAFVLCDYLIVVPTVEEMSGKIGTDADIAKEDTVEIHVSQQYISTSQYGGGQVIKERPPFAHLKLGKYAKFINEDPIIIPQSLPSLTHLKPVTKRFILDMDQDYEDGLNFMIAGFPHLFKTLEGKPVLWDPELDQPSSTYVDTAFPAGAKLLMLNSDKIQLDFGDVIGFLTTVTKILTVVAAFL